MTRSIPRISLEEAQKLWLLADAPVDESVGTWTEAGHGASFYRTVGGAILVRPYWTDNGSYPSKPSSKLFSDSYGSAELIGGYRDPNIPEPVHAPEPEPEEPELNDDPFDDDEDDPIDEAHLASADQITHLIDEIAAMPAQDRQTVAAMRLARQIFNHRDLLDELAGPCGRYLQRPTTDTVVQRAEVAGKMIHDHMRKNAEGTWQASWVRSPLRDLVDWTLVGQFMMMYVGDPHQPKTALRSRPRRSWA
jgi:hypothetical protein